MAQSSLDKLSALVEVVQKLVSASQQQQADVKSAAQISVDQLSKFEPALQNLNDATAGMKNDLIGEKNSRDMQQSSMQGQLATMTAQFSSSGTGAGKGGSSKAHEPIVTNKLMMKKK